MTPEKARAIWAIYVWCRRTDELVDGPNASRMNPRVSHQRTCLSAHVLHMSEHVPSQVHAPSVDSDLEVVCRNITEERM